MKTLIVILLFCLILCCNADILYVPQQYNTIRIAAAVATDNDTILIAHGTYIDTLTLTCNITIASLYLFNNDTNSIVNTIWQFRYNRASIFTNTYSISLIGIKFQSLEPPPSNCAVLRGTTISVNIDHCYFYGTINTNNSLSVAAVNPLLINDTLRPTIRMTHSRFFGSENSRTPWLNCQGADRVEIDNCLFTGRASNALYAIELFSVDTIIIKNSVITSLGETIRANGMLGVRVESCIFTGLNRSAVTLSSYSNQTLISNCTFENFELSTINSNYIIQVNQTPFFGTARVENCRFNNLSAAAGRYSIFYFRHGQLFVNNCDITNNNSNGAILYSDNSSGNTVLGRMELMRVSDNTFTNAVYTTHSGTQFEIEFCDFDRNLFTDFTWNINTVNAPNCWWGHATGPNHPSNPAGLGQILPASVNPNPWRTTPVFPQTNIQPIHSEVPANFFLSQNYPNPFNHSTSIKYTLRRDSKVTLSIFDIHGRQILPLINKNQTTGNYSVSVSLPNLPSGIYFYRLTTFPIHSNPTNLQPSFAQSKKMMYIR